LVFQQPHAELGAGTVWQTEVEQGAVEVQAAQYLRGLGH
jgi:hypothetical protein